MNEEIILVAETGSDLTPQQAQENGIYLVPMHVTMGDQTLDDGSFPPEEVCAYYQKTGTVPKTSASGPFDFKTVFDRLHEQFPDKKILHLAYSAVTTASSHNALLEGEHRSHTLRGEGAPPLRPRVTFPTRGKSPKARQGLRPLESPGAWPPPFSRSLRCAPSRAGLLSATTKDRFATLS